MAKSPTFEVLQDVEGSAHNPQGGPREYRFSKGSVSPRNEFEESVLRHLVSLGLARPTAAKAEKAEEAS